MIDSRDKVCHLPLWNGRVLMTIRLRGQLSRSRVATFYGRNGASVTRIRQIEMDSHVSQRVQVKYLKGIEAALKDRDRGNFRIRKITPK